MPSTRTARCRLSEEEPEDPRIGDLDLLFYDGRRRRRRRVREASGRPLRPGGPHRRLRGRAGAAGRPRRASHGGVAGHLRPAADGAGNGEQRRPPRIVFRSASNEALLSMVRFGLGFAILPKLAVTGVEDDHPPGPCARTRAVTRDVPAPAEQPVACPRSRRGRSSSPARSRPTSRADPVRGRRTRPTAGRPVPPRVDPASLPFVNSRPTPLAGVIRRGRR